MKKNKWFVLVWMIVLFLPFQMFAQKVAGASLIIEQPVYVFPTAPEGGYVSHDFILKNTGKTLIRITKVRPP